VFLASWASGDWLLGVMSGRAKLFVVCINVDAHT